MKRNKSRTDLKVCVVANPQKVKIKRIAEDICTFLRNRGTEILDLDKINRAEMVIVIGGDGMLLYTARFLRRAIPVLLISAGSFSFLSRLTPAEFRKNFNEILNGKYRIENRFMLSAYTGKQKFTALNEFVIERRTHRAVVLKVRINDRNFATYLCDGLILSTPTGSTAYSLAAGGPVVNPQLCAFILNPVSPHTLVNRAFVLSENDKVEIIPKNDCFLTVDGQEKIPVPAGNSVVVKKASSSFRLIQIGDSEFYKLVNRKLGSVSFRRQ